MASMRKKRAAAKAVGWGVLGFFIVLGLGLLSNVRWGSMTLLSPATAQTLQCAADVDKNGSVDVATDLVYIARHVLGLDPVPPSFRALDPNIPDDTVIAANIEAAGAAYDVDASGSVDVATDLVYIGRHQLELTPVPPSFRVLDPGIPPDADIVAAIEALCQSDGPPPEPSDVAPPVDPNVPTSVFSATEFLYSGANPIQTGVAEGTIAPKRAAVIRGTVLDRDDNPLAGATITILNHPEFGQTLSRADGMFDLAVNGGGPLIVNYQKTGFLPAQRRVQAPWQDYVFAEDVVLIPQDVQATTIDLTDATQDFLVAQGSPVTDADGTRQATLLIPQGTQAQVYNPDGTTRAVTSLNLRLTEYTVGDNGPEAMPGPLPPQSAYTYAFEMKADEADIKIDGKDVMFDRPVAFYIDNFLDFPAGMAVPVGYYDKDKAAWIPSSNGRVIKILSITDGLADIDGDGDDAADDAGKLAALGVTDEERAKLAELYPVGKTLWRVQVTHLSTWDCNWPYRPPNGAEAPQQPPLPPEPDPKPDNGPCPARRAAPSSNAKPKS